MMGPTRGDFAMRLLSVFLGFVVLALYGAFLITKTTPKRPMLASVLGHCLVVCSWY